MATAVKRSPENSKRKGVSQLWQECLEQTESEE